MWMETQSQSSDLNLGLYILVKYHTYKLLILRAPYLSLLYFSVLIRITILNPRMEIWPE